MRRILLTQDFYQQRIRTAKQDSVYAEAAQHVGWNNPELQLLSYAIASDLAGITWSKVHTILDIGCGYGLLLDYLRDRHHYQGKYVGLDLMRPFIVGARKRYESTLHHQFIEADFLDWQLGNQSQFEIVFCLGALSVNYDYPGVYGQISWQYAVDLITAICQLAKSAIILYFPCEDHATVGLTRANSTMAFYQSTDLANLFLELKGAEIANIEVQSYPSATDISSIMKVQLKSGSNDLK
jgi:SAM-dependent methyltransferase